MAGEIIRQGDKTSHGGTVIEGSILDICMGKPIAFVGHKVVCRRCKGIFAIVEGAPTTTFYGKGVALAGMKTACGASLLASQFTDVVEYGGGGSSSANKLEASTASASAAASPLHVFHGTAERKQTDSAQFDDRFILIDDVTGDPLAFTEYAIRRASGEIEYGTTDSHSCTHLLAATANAELIEIYV